MKGETHLSLDLLLQLRLQHTVQKPSLRVTVKQRDDAFPLLDGGESFMMAQFSRKQQIHIFFSVLTETGENTTAAAGANGHRPDFHFVELFTLRNGDGESFRIAETQADAVDDCEEGDGFGEADYAAHACACMFVS